MTDERTGRELTPREEGAEVAEVGGVPSAPGGDQLAVERFAAGPRAHSVSLTEERSAQIVRQSGNARTVAFLAVLIVALFIPIYWFYDIGAPALGAGGRMAAAASAQYVNDVSQGYSLFIANCARCHGPNGEGGIGPPLNSQPKLYNAVTAAGLPGTGHLNPTYIQNVLTVGGRYVCGDPNSIMPTWAQPVGPLNYRQIEELVAWLTASDQVKFTYTPPVSEVGGAIGPSPTPVVVNGWRDPTWTPAPSATPVPACWRNPSGTIGGAPAPAPSGSAAAIIPGTAANPRVIQLKETASLTITDSAGNALTSIPVAKGEVVEFQVTNTAGFDHNFYIGAPSDLASANTGALVGVPAFSSGTQTVKYTIPSSAPAGGLQVACTLPGHYQTMHVDLAMQP